MKDQVQHLRERRIKAACIVSGLNGIEQEIIYNNCIHGKIKILYVSPERLAQRPFIEHLRQIKVSLIAVDEAHCISQWGYDFRPSYLEIARIRNYFPSVPVLALTATATPTVVDDIRQQLLFRQGSRSFQTSFQRNNLAYMVFKEEDKQGRLLRIINAVRGSGIIYVRSRRRTRELADFLVRNNISATYYHAGLEAKERDTAQLRWMKGEVSVIVATNAFGMGIDKPDVRFVIHLDIPSSIEAYFQEAGRAGRDGLKSYAVLLYNANDIELLQHNVESRFPSRKEITNIYHAICNYYQIPIGAGCDCQFDFDAEALCQTYHFDLMTFYSGIRFLEREGLILVPDREEAFSQLYIPVSNEDLYRFQVSQPRYSDLVSTLLRLYGGLFTEFVSISERAIARKLFLDEAQVTHMLQHLDALKYVIYKKKCSVQQIHFTAPRTNTDELYLTESNYKALKETAEQQVAAIQQYVLADSGCRSSMLLRYFGEVDTTICGICDLCITQKKSAPQNALRVQILEILKAQPLRVDQLLAQLESVDEREIKLILRQLVDERVVSINKHLQFFA